MSREFALYIPSCGAIDYAKAEEILTDSMLRMVLVPWGVFFTDLSKNIDEYDDPYDLEVEYQDFLSELHEWLPESCNSFGKMMSHISSSEQLNMIDELAGQVMNFISVALGSVLPESVAGLGFHPEYDLTGNDIEDLDLVPGRRGLNRHSQGRADIFMHNHVCSPSAPAEPIVPAHCHRR